MSAASLLEPGRTCWRVEPADRFACLVDGERPAGTHEVRLDTARLAPGVYIAHLGTEAGGLTRRLTVVR